MESVTYQSFFVRKTVRETIDLLWTKIIINSPYIVEHVDFRVSLNAYNVPNLKVFLLLHFVQANNRYIGKNGLSLPLLSSFPTHFGFFLSQNIRSFRKRCSCKTYRTRTCRKHGGHTNSCDREENEKKKRRFNSKA